MKLILMSAFVGIFFGQTASAETVTELKKRSVRLVCDDRTAVFTAECFKMFEDSREVGCASLNIAVTETKTGKKLGSYDYKPNPKSQAVDYAVIEGTPSEAICAETPKHERYFVVRFSNGGNCEECEWVDVMNWDGSFFGSSRTSKANKSNPNYAKQQPILRAASDAAYGPKGKKLGETALTKLHGD